MRIFLVGMMGSGKSTIGKRVSEVLDLQFIDMDEEIERREGRSVRRIFEEDGEEYFRLKEKELLRELVERDNVVVATGGGVVIDPENRELLKKEKTLFLYAPPEVLMERVTTENRPLLREGKERIREIWEKRKQFYAEFRRIDTSKLNEWETTALVVLEALDEKEISTIEKPHLVKIILGGFKRVRNEELVFTTERVEKIYGRYLPENRLLFPDGEEVKTLEHVSRAYYELVRMDFPRGKTIAGVGGGALTDFTGFVASTFKRGVGLSFYPTTLLAQVDASVGGKNAIDFAGVKNVVGTFRMPDYVIIDPTVTLSMDEGRFEEGVVEAFKMTILSGRGVELFDEPEKIEKRNLRVLSEMVKISVEDKARIVMEDPYDMGLRHALNLGHTLGHVYEMLEGVPHGIAVAWGIEKETMYLYRKGIVPKETMRWIVEKVKQIVPIPVPSVDVEKARNLILNDKKILKGSRVRLPYVKEIGKIEFLEVDPLELLEVVD
ncbi:MULTISPECIES: bifunctional shikimate kinase AroK/3-dehydroquinate synthase AroB [Thermotoga]|jgi:shikimate kinase/3-dehydroquinate synthase|uniref:Shikimate kinase n=1 Tax=Thermotoga petrophila (strain ATCC BAA-489 / DSM 13996 / JCM 10882 / RKU-10) TaxID=590168 RepID=D2C7Y6_THEP2|nr:MULTISPECIES: bifunctional shikimate kinase AroK/3-dehydroquinate synthase AroB [Thermotoga]ADA67072.1 3-dehydroquinate synthase [Thermotoga petrophila RKU-10]AIY87923.1 bifunctional shikimate kinase/3-dehydroquinate synthase [Thermotoga sp. Cell2]KHC90998.1 bifunctional shikimate kinase/3-dehydroquinate synthase [Thermotoga sp. TBGT1765]KHC91911.1 bifunctional shikimate kinase/3-dehydroquinate synthase [Thermotoga sp. TBGT1766]KHC96795.1 bifunctional shikimate kinase/3-dehydroquinate synth